MTRHISTITNASLRTLGYAEKLFEGINPATAAAKPRFGDTVIDTNTPVFVLGHLAIYPVRIGGFYGIDSSHLAAPAEWTELFAAGKPCLDDPKGTIYPKLDVVRSAFFKNMRGIIELISNVDDALLLKETPDEKMRASFPTLGTATNFLLNNHVMMHGGQVSAWRRCMGLPSAL